MKLMIVVTLLMMLTGCVTPKFKPGIGSVSDAATTYYAIEWAGGRELNPLLNFPSPILVAASTVGVKHLSKHLIYKSSGDEEMADAIVETGGVAAAGWNVAIILGAPPFASLPVAIAFGYSYWANRNKCLSTAPCK